MDDLQPPLNFLRHRIKLRHLRLVQILEEERSVSRAAERLCISQAAVSKTRAEIEAEIGAPLFERNNNRLEVTEFGKRVLQSARRILGELDSLCEEVGLLHSGMRGTLTIGIRSISAQPFIARATAAFKKVHPELTIRLIDADLPSLVDRLVKGDIPLLVGRVDAEHARVGFDSRVIFADPNVVVASPEHPLARKAKLDWAELITQRWCLTPEGYAGRLSREHLSTHLARLNLPLPADLVETNSLLMIITLFQAGDFLSLAPLAVGIQLARRRLARLVDVPPVGPVDPVRLMWRSDVVLPPAAKLFRDFAIGLLSTEPPLEMTGQAQHDHAAARRFGVVAGAKEGEQRGGKLYRRPATSSTRLSSV